MAIIFIFFLLPFISNGLSTNVTDSQKSVVQEKVAVADIGLLIDQSESIREHYHEELDFAKKFVNSFPIGANLTRFAFVSFSFANMTKVRLSWADGITKDKVLSTLDSMENDTLGAGTDFARVLSVASEQLLKPSAGDRSDVPNVLVLVTDGFFNNPWEKRQTIDAAKKLRDAGVLLYAIQVKTDPSLPVGQGPVQDLALLTGTPQRVFAVENFQQLTDELLAKITQQISVEYDNCVYEYVQVGACYYLADSDKCVADGDLKIERPPKQPYGQPCPSLNRTQINCQQSDGCRKIKTDSENTISALPANAEKAVRSADSSNNPALPFWAIVTIGVVAGVILLLIIIGVIVARTPRWKAIFTPSKPRKPQLPGTADDSHSSSSASSGV